MDQLRQSLGLLQMAFDAASDAMLILDAGMRVRWANQRAADLWANGLGVMLPGKTLDDLLVLHRGMGDPMASSDPDHPLVQMRQGDGVARYLLGQPPGGKSASLSPWMVSWRGVRQQGAGAAVLLGFRELGPAELALEQQQLLINQLAHEVRTPLSIVMGSLHRLDRDPGLQPASRSQLQVACEEGRRIGRVFDNLAVLTQLESSSYPWCFEFLSLKTPIERWLGQLDQTIKERIQVEFAEPAQDRIVRLDVQACVRVLNQLLDNSLRYSSESTPLLLRSQVVGDVLELLFMDWGSGIPADRRELVFERFIRLERHRDPSRSDGAGLGLAVAKGLIEGMDGGVAVVSHPEEAQDSTLGTVVRLRFPLATQQWVS